MSLADFYFQPAELTKITTLLYLAWLLFEKKSFLMKLTIVILPCILLMLQLDFGSRFLILVVACSLLFIGGQSIKLLFIGFGVGIVSLAALILSAPYRLKRITAFLDPWEDPLGAGFQAIQSF